MENCYLLCIEESVSFKIGRVYRVKNDRLYSEHKVYNLKAFGIKTLEKINWEFEATFEPFVNEENISVSCICGKEIIMDGLGLHNMFSEGYATCLHPPKKPFIFDTLGLF